MRSSSPLEDGEENLFQGVFGSSSAFFAVDKMDNKIFDDQLYQSFEEVLLSPWTAYAESYLRNRHLVGKVSRSMAEMIQVIPDNLEFIGRGYFDSNGTEVEYLDHIVDSGDYVGNKIFVSKGIITKRIDNVKDYAKRVIGDYGKLMSDEKAIEISQIIEKLSIVLPEYNKRFNIEFGIDEKGKVYLFQIRPTKRTVVVEGTIPDFYQFD